jgi:hypothetical protein
MGRSLALVLGVALAAGCADSPTDVADDAPDFVTASYDVFGDGYGFADGSPRHLPGIPVFGRLLAQARMKVVAEQGEEAARALFANLHALRETAAAARRAQDRDAFQAAIEALHAEAGRLIVEILGAARAPELIELAATRLAALDAVIANRGAAGADVTRLEHARGHAADLLAAAEAALAADDVLGAMLKAARSAQLSTVAAHHGTRMRPPRDRP